MANTDLFKKAINEHIYREEFNTAAELAEKKKWFANASRYYEKAGNLRKAYDMAKLDNDEIRALFLYEGLINGHVEKKEFIQAGALCYGRGDLKRAFEVYSRDKTPEGQILSGKIAEEIGSDFEWKNKARRCYKKAISGIKGELEEYLEERDRIIEEEPEYLKKCDIQCDSKKIGKDIFDYMQRTQKLLFNL